MNVMPDQADMPPARHFVYQLIAPRPSLSQPAVVRLTVRLADAGLLRRKAIGRRVLLRATPAGRGAAVGLQNRRGAVLRQALGALGDPEQQSQFGDLLAAIASRLPQRPGDYLRICRVCAPEECGAAGSCPVWVGQSHIE